MKIVNILISSVALLLVGYYIGINNNSTKVKETSQKESHVILSKDKKDKTKEVLLRESISNTQPIEFKVKVISASMENEHVDKSLKKIKSMFNSVAQFSEFRLLKDHSFKVKVGETKKIILPNNKIIYFTPRNIDANKSLALNIRIPWVLNINLHTKTNEGFFQGGLKNGDDFIILYIEPNF